MISDKCYKVTDFNGNTDFIPKSQVFGVDTDVGKSDAYWISEWILKKKTLTYSTKKKTWFSEHGIIQPYYEVKQHVPVPITNKTDSTEINNTLIRPSDKRNKQINPI
jgi:hypothetical protein